MVSKHSLNLFTGNRTHCPSLWCASCVVISTIKTSTTSNVIVAGTHRRVINLNLVSNFKRFRLNTTLHSGKFLWTQHAQASLYCYLFFDSSSSPSVRPYTEYQKQNRKPQAINREKQIRQTEPQINTRESRTMVYRSPTKIIIDVATVQCRRQDIRRTTYTCYLSLKIIRLRTEELICGKGAIHVSKISWSPTNK